MSREDSLILREMHVALIYIDSMCQGHAVGRHALYELSLGWECNNGIEVMSY
jgi:hypothetical protein